MLDSRLSPFHAELLEFLERDVKKRCEKEGLNPFQQKLHLSEIIDHYQHLFGANQSIYIEKWLMEALPAKEFIDLGLTRYYPRMYRGLPRIYHRNSPSQSQIKPNFTHLPSLKKQAVAKALYSLYGKMVVKGKVTIFTWVIPDGMGDYIAAVEVLRILRARLPDVEVRLVALVQEKAMTGLAYPEGSVVVPYEKECTEIGEEALEVMRNCDLVLQVPTYYPGTQQLLEQLKGGPKVEMIGEYGFLESSWFHPKSGRYSMGLHFLEKGILVRKACQASWDDVKNERLQLWRKPENRFYLAYLSTEIGGAIYLHSLLKSLENMPEGIDICVPDLGWFIKFVERQNQEGKAVIEWDVGVQSIEVYFQDQIHAIQVAPKGKKVRLLCPGSISQSDFRALLALSGDWVAVRGNQSLSEAISQGKPFFYDGREHARYFIKDLVAVAENRIGQDLGTLECIRGMGQGFLYNLPVQEGEWVDETFFQTLDEWTSIALKIGLSLQDPETIIGFKKFNQLLVEEFSANQFLCHVVQRALCHREYPQMEKLEHEEFARFAAQAQSFTQMIQSHRLHLSNCK